MADVRSISPKRFLALGSEHMVAQAFWVVSFALFAAIGARLEIPHQPVPYTFQTLAVILAGGLLGSRNGFLSMMLYLILGLVGMPVFAGGGFGLVKLIGPTGGYLLSFPVAAFLVGSLVSYQPAIISSKSVLGYAWTMGAMMSGLLVVFAMGTIQLNIVYFHDWTLSIQSGFLIFSPWDVLKLVAATTICRELRRR
ncbi:MAG: biotin transporter BioY [Ignavibacteriales bacterium]|nr:biotin transporter BioY [Ignavibacteriales bacterium]